MKSGYFLSIAKIPFLSFLLITLLFLLNHAVFAQTSDCVVTQVGTPDASIPKPTCPGESGTTPSPNTPPGRSNNDYVKVAEDLKAAYDACSNGDTHEYQGLADCLNKELEKFEYDEQRLSEFEKRRQTSLYDSDNVPGGLCSECLGYVGIVTALWAGTSNPETTFGTLYSAGEVNSLYGNGDPVPVGNTTFKVIGAGVAPQIQPGDIAVAGYSGCGCDHIGIVYSTVKGSDAHMFLIESNGNLDCRITTDRGPVPKDGYVFYRKQ